MVKFNLSDKQEIYKIPMGGENIPFYWEKDVQELIRRLKVLYVEIHSQKEYEEIVDELVGNHLNNVKPDLSEPKEDSYEFNSKFHSIGRVETATTPRPPIEEPFEEERNIARTPVEEQSKHELHKDYPSSSNGGKE